MNQKIAEVYQNEGVNPLAGCIPAIIQLPVFIGLYRAVLSLAKENKLDESFLWLPSLEGPTYGADPASGSDWILKGWEGGVPTLGWEDTLALVGSAPYVGPSKLGNHKNDSSNLFSFANDNTALYKPIKTGNCIIAGMHPANGLTPSF